MNFEDRFWSKTRPVGDCIEWTSTKSRGYGQFRVSGKYKYAHRVSYEMLIGPIPENITLDHLCRNRACVNPDHLDPCTLKENILRGVGQPAINARKLFCVNGHEFTEENTRFVKLGRGCRACDVINKRRYRERQHFAAL